VSPFPFFTSLVERATLRAPALERRPRSLFEPAAAGPTAGETAGGTAAMTAAMTAATTRATTAKDGRGDETERAGDPGAGAVGTRGAAEREGSARAFPPGSRRGRGARPDEVERSPSAPWAHEGSDAAPSLGSDGRRPGGEERLVFSDGPQYGALGRAALLENARAAISSARDGARRGPPADGPRTTPLLALVPATERPADRGAAGGNGDANAVTRARRTAAADRSGTGAAAAGGPAAGASAALLRGGPRIPGPPASIVRSQAGARAPRADDGGAAPPAPVQITIGRIEVRASVGAADRPPVRRPAPGPKMSLDDYLHGRRGGAR
jgi:hypothetical protein